jgi:O-antigen/teichoic acid export membrane protein
MRPTEGSGPFSSRRDAGDPVPQHISVSARRALHDTVRYVPSVVAPALLGFALVPVLTRLLTPHQYGAFALVSAAVSGVGAITNGWLTSSVLRMYPDARGQGYARRFLLIVAGDGLISVIVSAILLIGISSVVQLSAALQSRPVAGVAIVIVATALVGDASCSILRSRLRASAYSLSMTVRALGKLAGCALGAYLAEDRLLGALVGWAVGAALTSLVPAVLARERKPGPPNQDVARSYRYWVLSRRLLSYGLPLSAGLVLQIVLSDVDRFLLQFLASTREVGIYAAAYQIASGCVGVAVSIPVMATLPLLMRTWDSTNGRERCHDLMPRLIQQYTVLTLPAAAAIAILAEPLLLLVTSNAYVSGAPTMIPVAIGVFFQGLGQYTTAGLLLVRRTQMLLVLLVVAVIVNVGANVVLIPELGMVGAGIATTIAYLVFAAGGLLATRQVLPLEWPLADLLRIAVATVVMSCDLLLIVHLLQHPAVAVPIAVMSGLLVYSGAITLLGELPWAPGWDPRRMLGR